MACESRRGRWGRPRTTGLADLSGRLSPNVRRKAELLTVHEDFGEQDLHRVKRVAQPEHRAQRDEHGRRSGGATLEGQEVLDVVEYRVACNTISELRTMGSKTDMTHLLRRPVGAKVVVRECVDDAFDLVHLVRSPVELRRAQVRMACVGCLTNSPSSIRVALALLHSAPTSSVSRKAAEARAGGAGRSICASSSTVYNSVTVCSFRVSVPEARQFLWKDWKDVIYYLSCQSGSRKWTRALRQNGVS